MKTSWSGHRPEPKHVVIVGGGFAGLTCAFALSKHRDVRITLIDKNNYQQFQPLLYQVAASMLSPGNAAFALRDMLRHRDNVDVQMGEVAAVDLAQRSVTTAAGSRYAGDYLMLATGSRVNFYGTPGAEEHTFPLYSLTDAERLRSAVLLAFEGADRDPAHAAPGALTFVVVGGGPTGVEMAGTLADMLTRVLAQEFRHVDATRAQVVLVERSLTVLGAFAPASQLYAATALRGHGVQLHLGVAVREVSPNGVKLADGVVIPSKTVVWAAGLKATAVPTLPELPRGSDGRIRVDENLRVSEFEGVYAIGDLANASGPDGKSLPQLAAVAQQAGRHGARNIAASIAGKPLCPFVYSDRGILAMVGRNAAVAELGRAHHQLVGPLAFATWLGVHAALLTLARAKVESVVEWAWEYFTGEHPGQLIDR